MRFHGRKKERATLILQATVYLWALSGGYFPLASLPYMLLRPHLHNVGGCRESPLQSSCTSLWLSERLPVYCESNRRSAYCLFVIVVASVPQTKCCG
jgi:hypothetical protein